MPIRQSFPGVISVLSPTCNKCVGRIALQKINANANALKRSYTLFTFYFLHLMLFILPYFGNLNSQIIHQQMNTVIVFFLGLTFPTLMDKNVVTFLSIFVTFELRFAYDLWACLEEGKTSVHV